MLCLLAFLAGGAGVLPSLFLVMATWDGTHTPQVRSTASQFKLVLHHRTPGHFGPVTEAGTWTAHRHGMAAKSLCLLSTPSPLDPDHRLELAPSSPTERTGGRTMAPPLWETPLVLFPSVELSSWQPTREPVLFPLEHNPPANAGPLSSTASTVLVI